MTLMGHLNEMRRRLARMVIMVLLGFIACYGVAEPVYAWLSEPLTTALPTGSKLIYTSPQGAFFVYLKVALVSSIFVTSPFSFYQIWAFIAPGLYREEKQAIAPLAFFSAFFFLAGASFCYFLVFPLAFRFFMGFTTDVIVPMISVEEYLSFALKLLIAFGLVFEMPLFAHFLAKLGVLSPDMMRRQRKYAILLIFIVAAVLTPPDVFSQCLMAAPMLLLYEVSVFVAALARKRRDAREAARHADAGKDNAHEKG
ncbi:MAG: twin-arginine translocase subunit TatC [Desulfovibrionaceae bacterium]|nr:twin-arginine translocase subunit TatC [Desulfovibrionaceae bacterium]